MGAVTVKGQVTIPKRIRDALGIRPGDLVEFDLLPDGGGARLRPAAAAAAPTNVRARWDQFRGIGRSGMTTDEIMRMTRGNPAEDPEVSLSEDVLALLHSYASRPPAKPG